MKRWYVTLTWHDWPEGGSFGEVVEAESSDEAEYAARLMMAKLWSKAIDLPKSESINEVEETMRSSWHLVDCWDVDEFIKQRIVPAQTSEAGAKAAQDEVMNLLPYRTRASFKDRKQMLAAICSMTSAQLKRLPGLGPVKAEKIAAITAPFREGVTE